MMSSGPDSACLARGQQEAAVLTLLLLCSAVFNGSVLCPYAILNEQQGVACQDPLPAARHSGTARKQLGPPQGFHRQRTKDDQPDPPGRREGAPVGGVRLRLGVEMLTCALLLCPSGFGCFHPGTHVSGDEDGLLPGKPLHTQPSEAGQRDAGRLGRHVWTDARSARPPSSLAWFALSVRLKVNICAFSPSGSGIGTGPGVIQDRYSPTMGRHRTNPLFNGHGGHIAPPPQSQFDMGPKSFVKSNQVGVASPDAWTEPSRPGPHLRLCRRCRISISRTRTTWPSSKSSPRTCLRVSARKARSTPTR